MADKLSSTFSALADPTRRAILARLSSGPATVNELAEPFSISLQAISRHLKVLERAGLITRGRDAQFRPCRLETEPLESAAAWIAEHRKIWDDRFDQLDQHLLDVQRKSPPAQPPPKKSSPPNPGIPAPAGSSSPKATATPKSTATPKRKRSPS